jgi:hypothetical protein
VIVVSLVAITLLQSLQKTPTSLSIRGQRFTAASVRATRHNSNKSARSTRIKKVTALFGEPNYLYEAAIASHERHNALHGYQMQVLRQRIHASFLSKPAFMMSILVAELAKPWDERVQWLV